MAHKDSMPAEKRASGNLLCGEQKALRRISDTQSKKPGNYRRFSPHSARILDVCLFGAGDASKKYTKAFGGC